MTSPATRSNYTDLLFKTGLSLAAVAVAPVMLWGYHGTMVVMVVAAAMGLPILLQRVRPGSLRPPFFVLMAVLFCIWAGLTTAWAITPDDAVERFSKLCSLTLAGLIGIYAASFHQRGADGRTLALALGAGCLFTASIMIYEYASNAQLLQMIKGPDVLLRWAFLPDYMKNASAALSILFWPAALSLVQVWGQSSSRWPVFVFCVGIATCIAASPSVAAAVAIVLSSVIAAFSFYKGRATGIVLAVVLGATFLAAPFVGKVLPSSQDVLEFDHRIPGSIFHRLDIYGFTSDRVMERPMLGWGLEAAPSIPGGDGRVDLDVYVPATKSRLLANYEVLPLHPHNAPLHLWLELGVLGALIYAVFVVWLALRISRIKDRLDRAACSGALAAALTVGMISFGFFQTWWMALQWLAAMLMIVLVRTRVRSTETSC